jgi:membrane glycosyltransferase
MVAKPQKSVETPKPAPRVGEGSSYVRARSPRDSSRAQRRVEEYIKILGLPAGEKVEAFARECAERTQVEDVEVHAKNAVREAQQRIGAWSQEVFEPFGGAPNPLWFRAFLTERPHVFLEDPGVARAEAEGFGDPHSGRLPLAVEFKKQRFDKPRLPRWLRGLLAPILTTAVMVAVVAAATLREQPGALGAAWLVLFSFLFGTTAIGFFTALGGFIERTRSPSSRGLGETSETGVGVPPAVVGLPRSAVGLPRSAVILPIYHEDAARVFANVAAMRESLLASVGGENFEFFVLSDSQDPLAAADEERAFRRVTADISLELPIYYRRRANNERQKVGNLAEFFGRWGERYRYVIVLDADSVMRGATMVELVRRMERSPKLGLLQAPIAQVGGETLLARALQWSTSVAGPLFAEGLARWSGAHGNYYGHNAVIRTRAFLDACSLPSLLGKPPLGGQILSHDFVEAALLCRDGWHVRTATDLEGSYEGLPPTLRDYVARDRRWCQGNLQHLRVVFAPGLRAMSRIHLLLGASSYLMGPAWLLFLGLGVLLSANGTSSAVASAPLLGLSLAFLLGPRLLGVSVTLANRTLRRKHGGAARLLLSTLFEILLSTALSPLLLFHHTRIVVSILSGRSARWSGQKRKASSEVGRILGPELGTTGLGIAIGLGLFRFAPSLLLWLAPVWLPLVLSMPIALLVSSPKLGVVARRLGLLLIASETEPDPILTRSDELLTLTESDLAGRFRDLILDPVLLDAHIRRIAKRSGASNLRALGERALRLGPTGLTDAEQQILMNDAATLSWLHEEAWCHWPVEAWCVARDRPQVPPQVSAS